ncbi:MAG: DEAD/DEAH box helicase [Planctomycetaceae bacterium]
MRQRREAPTSGSDVLSRRSLQDTRLPVALTGDSRRSLPMSAFEVKLQSPSLALDVDIFSSGTNGALRRWSPVECRTVSAEIPVGTVPSWKPGWPQIRTVGLAFPDAVQFLPIKHGGEEELEVVRKKKERATGAGQSESPQRRSTKLQPPDDALSLEDRLFYILQPPLETMLGGQELIMPFEPFPHQYQGIGWLFSQNSALLADEMGLGKTMQTITAVRLLLRGGRIRSILFVCPKPLIPNWQREFRMWAEELPVVTVEGDTSRRRIIWTMQNIPIRIVNYEVLVRDMEQLSEEEKPRFDLVVLDEAQRIKNRDSKTAEIVRGLSRQRSWALTGTPIENRPEEMASLFEFMEVVPPRATPDLRQLSQIADVYVLRRTKNIAMKDMPPLLDREEYLELSPAQEYAYHTAEKEGIIQLNELGEMITVQHVFELVLRLKQITNFDPLTGESTKRDRLIADMEEIAASGKKAILFSQWTKALDWLAPSLEPFGPLIYHGGVPSKKREPILKQFEEDPEKHILLMSYGTGAVGLNLQFAEYVFLFDRWWNPAVEDQAINRAHRIGQKNTVIVTKFISKDTIEERIDAVLKHKREIFEAVLGDGDVSTASLSLNAAEIFGLFDLKARTGRRTTKIVPKVEKNDHAA